MEALIFAAVTTILVAIVAVVSYCRATEHKPKPVAEASMPTTVSAAADFIIANLSEPEKQRLREGARVSPEFGRAIRNKLGVWHPESPLKEEVREKYSLFGHGDDTYEIIMACVKSKLLGVNPKNEMTYVAHRCTAHWVKQGVNPQTGEKYAKS